MAKITISQLHTADASSIQELTNTELDATKGGLLNGGVANGGLVNTVVAPFVGVSDVAVAGQNKTAHSYNDVLSDVLQNVGVSL